MSLLECVSHHQALEKNQQWLVYDQQREVYVQSVLARTAELEQQLAQAKQQQPKQESTSDGDTNLILFSTIMKLFYNLLGKCS